MIYLLWPTIRPDVFKETYKIWESRAVSNFTTITNTDIYDRIGVCAPSYKLSSTLIANEDDIVILASDDFYPPIHWDEYVINKLSGKTGALFVNDGYQLPDSSNMKYPSITIPIMTYGCLLKLNKIIYHPEYNHMFSDSELYLNLKELDLLIDDRKGKEFTHNHWVNGKRNADIIDGQYNLKWKDDENTWNRRRKLPVEERIKIIK